MIDANQSEFNALVERAAAAYWGVEWVALSAGAKTLALKYQRVALEAIGLTPETIIVPRSLIERFLACPEIADCAPEDMDQETRQLEKEARAALADRRGALADFAAELESLRAADRQKTEEK
jgi:hypothetical protein